MNTTLVDLVSEVISNGDDSHHFRESAAEAIMYVAAWLHEEGFWQASSVLKGEVHDQLIKERDIKDSMQHQIFHPAGHNG
jgi:hypothetical protein